MNWTVLFGKVSNIADTLEMEVPKHIEPRNVANYFIFISHDSLEKNPPKKKKRTDDILRYAESKLIISNFVRDLDRKLAGSFATSLDLSYIVLKRPYSALLIARAEKGLRSLAV